MNLYIMRHGKTVWNEIGKTQGRSQNRLSKNGVEATNLQAQRFANTKIDAIICSPLMRAMQTANIMNKYHHAPIFKDDDLTEIGQGIFTGRHPKTLTSEELKLKRARSHEAGMESYFECYTRAKHFFGNLKQKYPYNNILVITHKCPAIYLEYAIENKPYEALNFSDEIHIANFENSQIKQYKI